MNALYSIKKCFFSLRFAPVENWRDRKFKTNEWQTKGHPRSSRLQKNQAIVKYNSIVREHRWPLWAAIELIKNMLKLKKVFKECLWLEV